MRLDTYLGLQRDIGINLMDQTGEEDNEEWKTDDNLKRERCEEESQDAENRRDARDIWQFVYFLEACLSLLQGCRSG